MEASKATKGMSGGLGDGEGGWHLTLATALDVEPTAYVRTVHWFVTSMHESVRTSGETVHLPFFNPADNDVQVSRLRMVNLGAAEIEVTVTGRNEAGEGTPPEYAVRLTLPARAACTLGVPALESGGPGAGECAVSASVQASGGSPSSPRATRSR